MNRKWLPIMAILAVLLVAGAIAALLLSRRPSPPAAASASLPEENAIDPVLEEMECIDRVLANANLRSEQVQPALQRCRSLGASETRLDNSQ